LPLVIVQKTHKNIGWKGLPTGHQPYLLLQAGLLPALDEIIYGFTLLTLALPCHIEMPRSCVFSLLLISQLFVIFFSLEIVL